MTPEALFGISVLLCFIAFGIVTALYIWPRLKTMGREDALTALVVPHTFRFVGLSFLVPGVVSPSLPTAFAALAAYGDLVAALLAIAAIGALAARASLALLLVWVFNIWGTLICLLPSIKARSVSISARARLARPFISPPLSSPRCLSRTR